MRSLDIKHDFQTIRSPYLSSNRNPTRDMKAVWYSTGQAADSRLGLSSRFLWQMSRSIFLTLKRFLIPIFFPLNKSRDNTNDRSWNRMKPLISTKTNTRPYWTMFTKHLNVSRIVVPWRLIARAAEQKILNDLDYDELDNNGWKQYIRSDYRQIRRFH